MGGVRTMRIFDGKEYRDMTEEEIAAMKEGSEKAAAEERHRPLSEAEVNSMLLRQQVNALDVDDDTAFRMKAFYPTFDEVVGQTVKQGFKFTHVEKLYKTLQPQLTIGAHYPPGIGTENLYAQICESHDGSKYDPIPYSGNMALENGKHYTQGGVTYRCICDTSNPVYSNLTDLVGLYVEAI
jgi:hypothetical protein